MVDDHCHYLSAVLAAANFPRDNIKKVPVEGVQGSFILENVLSKEECEVIMQAVRNLTESDPKYLAGLQDDTMDDSMPESDRRRRKSQHHTPCYVEDGVLANLLRPHLPEFAGPKNKAILADFPLSNFLRCYDYHTGDFSMPHFDRSFSHHEQCSIDTKSRHGGRLVGFTAYSVLLYLNDDFEGGYTSFFPVESISAVARSSRGNSPKEILPDSPRITVVPRQGDVLVFPHGRQSGCHPDPLHEGSIVTSGRKTIIRTDVNYCVPSV